MEDIKEKIETTQGYIKEAEERIQSLKESIKRYKVTLKKLEKIEEQLADIYL